MVQAKIADSITVAIDTLELWDRNPRSIKGDRFNELKERLKRQGQIKPLLVAKDGTTVIGGNMRLRAMKELGIEEVWISQTEAQTDKEIFDLALTDNEEFGYYEQEQVAELALELGLSPLELKSYALSLGEPTTLDLVIDKFGPEDVEEDDVPEVDETMPPVSVLGEVYQLGLHRLMCGDAVHIADVTVLIEHNDIDLLLTDPPYGIAVNNDWQNKVHTDNQNYGLGEIMNDKGDLDLSILTGYERRVVFGFPYIQDAQAEGWLVWDKEPGFKGRSLTSPIEMAYSTCWKGFRANRLLWSGYMREDKSEEKVGHPTQKPTRLLADILKDTTEAGQNVLDLFGGSGSTLIACEQTNRTCYMMELHPKYCDVIRKRYAKHIGEEDWQSVTPVINAKELQDASR